MSRFEELCQAYAEAKERTELSRQACRQFLDDFISGMRDYFQAPIECQNESFDKDSTMHFDITLTLYENPNDPENSWGEKVVLFCSLEKILDNYVLMIFPWMNQFKLFEKEWEKFEEVYQHIFECVKEIYINPVSLSEQEKIRVRKIGWCDE
ncbi:MAG: hypothetical protein AB4058_00440 [Microcystaceae cyanobacterium]